MTYLGHDVLTLDYNRVGAIEERLKRKFVLLDSKTGKRVSDEQAPAPAGSRPFTWTALGRTEIATMRAFLDARVGRAVPFWLPSFQWDLALAEVLSFLKLCRLEDDRVEISYPSGSVAEATIRVREVPLEAPL